MGNRYRIAWLSTVALIVALSAPASGAVINSVPDLSGHGHNGTPGAGFATATSPTFNPSSISFTRSTDTILLSGDVSISTQATYEAIVRFSTSSYGGSGEGGIWDSWQSGAQDSRLSIINPGVMLAYAWDVNFPFTLTVGSLTANHLYDLAYVYDGTAERIYIDGTFIYSRSASGTIKTGPSNVMTLGAIFRDNGVQQSFLGDLQSLRISDTARYFGSSYTPNFGYFGNDSNTQLLINAPEPSALLLCILPGSACLMRRRRTY